jgi:uncharacterized protein
MERSRTSDLEEWALRPVRQPLVLRGARQVGKSWLVRNWGATHFGRVVEANLERQPELAACFSDNDPRATLRRLEVVLGSHIAADGKTLLFLDEIQAAPEVLGKLRWFAEELPELPVIAAGSLLDFALADHSFSMPVGRITFLHLEPMGFEEFCLALGEERLVHWLRSEVDAPRITARAAMPDPLHQRALGLFRAWSIVGGMPAAVESYRVDGTVGRVAEIHRDLLATWRDDFAKYARRIPHRRLTKVLESVPQQVGCKWSYRRVDPEERAAALRQAIDLLCLARVCHRVTATPARGLPLAAGAEDDRFKLLHLDVGLVSSALGLSLLTLEQARDLVLVHRGALAEQAVGQLLRLTFPANQEPVLHFWQRQRRGSEAELDYVHAVGARTVAVEVKSGAAGALRSLHAFMAERESARALRINTAPPMVQPVDVTTSLGTRARYSLLSLPPYLVEQAGRLIEAVRLDPSRLNGP